MQCFRFIYKKSVQHQNSTNNTDRCNVFISIIRKAYSIRIVQILSINAMLFVSFIRKADNIRIVQIISIIAMFFVSFIRKAYNIRIVQIISINAMFSFHL